MKKFGSSILSKLLFPVFGLILAIVSAQISLAQGTSVSFSEVYRADDNSTIPSAYSQLVRTGKGIGLSLHTSELEPGAYTVWWVVHNYPQFCSARPCTLADEENPLVAASVLNATGGVVGKSEIGSFAAYLRVGDTSSGEVLFGPGLLNPFGADILPVVRYHGPVIPKMMPAQITTFTGGCDVNECSDPQYSYHAGE